MAAKPAIDEMSSNAKILVASVDAEWRALICDWLRVDGFAVGDADSESAAIGKCLEEKPDLIVVRFGGGIGAVFFQHLATIVDSLGAFAIATLDRAISPEERTQVLALRVDGFLNGDLARDETIASIRAFARQKQATDQLKRMAEKSDLDKPISKSSAPLRERCPHVYKAVLHRYEDAINQVLQRRIYKMNDDVFEPFRQIAKELFGANASARDVVELHYNTLRKIAPTPDAPRAQAYLEVGRTTIIGLMGDLLTLYRETPREGISEKQISDAATKQWKECAQQ
jgi:DNA-binding NarL/FixJ family response regulator